MKTKFQTLCLIAATGMLLCAKTTFAQNNVGIGTTTPNSTAVLDLTATDKGLLVPRMATAQRTTITSPAKGLLVFDTDTNTFWYFDGAQWVEITTGGGGGGTLDAAYDFGGAGAGRTINADANPVQIIGTGTVTPNQGRLHTTTAGGDAVTPSTAITGEINTGGSVGFGVAGTVTNSDNPGAGVYAESNGTGQAVNAVMTGTGSAGYFEVTNPASPFSAVSGQSNGSGDVILGLSTGTGRAGAFEVNNSTNTTDAVTITSNGNSVSVLRSQNLSTGVAINASNTNAANAFATVQATTISTSVNAAGVVGSSTSLAPAVVGQIASASATAQQGVLGINARTDGGHGVRGTGYNGVVGETNYSSGIAVYGENQDAIAPLGNGIGVGGVGYYGVLGEDRYLGGVAGAAGIFSNGDLIATGAKPFRIDHPLDPKNKFLKHFAIESPEILNMYRGNAVMDNSGQAKVVLPDYFSSININFSYQLTPIGDFAQLFIKKKVENGEFVIGGGKPGMEVSWILTAERNDLYIQKNPQAKDPEPKKRPSETGKYQMPYLYGKPDSYSMFKLPHSTRKEAKDELVNILNTQTEPVNVQKNVVKGKGK